MINSWNAVNLVMLGEMKCELDGFSFEGIRLLQSILYEVLTR